LLFACDGSPELSFGQLGYDDDGNVVRPDQGGDDTLDGVGEGGAGSGSGTGGTGTCSETTGNAEQVPSTMLFVIDKSGSMNCNEPALDPTCLLPQKVDAAAPSKWEMTRDALNTTFGNLGKLTGLGSGLVTFPQDNHCAVLPEGQLTTEIAALDAAQVTALTAAMNAATPDGNTPLYGAGIRGLEALRERVVSGKVTGRVFMVLMTDGAETCQPAAQADLLSYVAAAQKDFGIQTFVIGAPGSEGARAILSELAFQGGTARSEGCVHGGVDPAVGGCHFDMTLTTDFATDLSAALTSITDTTALTCEFDVPPGAFTDPNKVNVAYTPSGEDAETVPQDLSHACDVDAEGWQFSADQTKVVLCGEVCDRVKSDPGGKVEVVFGCRETLLR